MMRDKMIDRWVEELDREIYDLLEFREELAGESLVIEDRADRQYATGAPYDEIRIINIPLEKNFNKAALEVLEAVDIEIDYAEAIERLKARKNREDEND